METNEIQKLNEVKITTYFDYPKKSIVRVIIPDLSPHAKEPYLVIDHFFDTATKAGEAIPGIKEFYKYFDSTKL